jgi:hypothetical protein
MQPTCGKLHSRQANSCSSCTALRLGKLHPWALGPSCCLWSGLPLLLLFLLLLLLPFTADASYCRTLCRLRCVYLHPGALGSCNSTLSLLCCINFHPWSLGASCCLSLLVLLQVILLQTYPALLLLLLLLLLRLLR